VVRIERVEVAVIPHQEPLRHVGALAAPRGIAPIGAVFVGVGAAVGEYWCRMRPCLERGGNRQPQQYPWRIPREPSLSHDCGE
jgi:hypothetical protein